MHPLEMRAPRPPHRHDPKKPLPPRSALRWVFRPHSASGIPTLVRREPSESLVRPAAWPI